jgi:hypothetical protein
MKERYEIIHLETRGRKNTKLGAFYIILASFLLVFSSIAPTILDTVSTDESYTLMALSGLVMLCGLTLILISESDLKTSKEYPYKIRIVKYRKELEKDD